MKPRSIFILLALLTASVFLALPAHAQCDPAQDPTALGPRPRMQATP
jgi:hypothetical protein